MYTSLNGQPNTFRQPHPLRRSGRVTFRGLVAFLVVLLTGLAFVGPAVAAEEEEPPTNLSYPVIWSDGAALLAPLEGAPSFTGAFTEIGGVNWYHQKDAGNVWQAQTLDAVAGGVDGVDVSTVDWGDNLEAKSWNVGQQIRVETVLFENLANPEISAALGGETTMDGYEMEQVNPPVKGPEEMWGSNGVTYASPEATVFSACARLTIQRLKISRSDPATSLLQWDAASATWTGSELIASPVFKGGVWEGGDGSGGYSAEVNIKGVVIYGYNWQTAGLEQGHYRLTFSLASECPAANLNTYITGETTVKESEEVESAGAVTAAEPEMGGGEGRVDGAGNLTYIDVQIGNPTYVPYVPPVPPPPAAGSSVQAGEVTPTRARTRMKVTLRTRTRSVDQGDAVILTGTAAPARNGARVVLQQRIRTRSGKFTFRNIKSARLRKHTETHSRFRFRVRAEEGATYRALVPGNGNYVKGLSTPLRIKIR